MVCTPSAVPGSHHEQPHCSTVILVTVVCHCMLVCTCDVLPVQQRSFRDVPIVDPPERVAGYFKLNRTHDAHMFYFFYESRSKGANDPVILWMTGQAHRDWLGPPARLDCTSVFVDLPSWKWH